MPDANALTYLNIQDAILGRRLPASTQRANVKRAIATAYQDVWQAEDWTFKRVSLSSLTVPASTNKPTMPTDYGDTHVLFDQYGAELRRMSEEEFERSFAAQLALGVTAMPMAYTVVDRQIILSSTPGATTYSHSYRRRLSHRDTGDAVVAGAMSVDTDYPLWRDNHSVLIPRALAIILQEINDPTWQDAQDEYERQLDRMRSDYQQTRPTLQWASWC